MSGILNNIWEGWVIEPHCLKMEGTIAWVGRRGKGVYENRIVVRGSSWEVDNLSFFKKKLPGGIAKSSIKPFHY